MRSRTRSLLVFQQRINLLIYYPLRPSPHAQVLYIQNFEWGMRDAQLDYLIGVLRLGRIWAVNVGENFCISRPAWCRFAAALPKTAVAYLYVSECHLLKCDLKMQMREAIRANRLAAPARDPTVLSRVTHMWYNPKLPTWWLLQQAGFTNAAETVRPALAAVLALPKSHSRDMYLDEVRKYCRSWMQDPKRGVFALPLRPRDATLSSQRTLPTQLRIRGVACESLRGREIALEALLATLRGHAMSRGVFNWRKRNRKRAPLQYARALA